MVPVWTPLPPWDATPAFLKEDTITATTIVERAVFETDMRLYLTNTFLICGPAGAGIKTVDKEAWESEAAMLLPSSPAVVIRRTMKCLGTLVSHTGSLAHEVNHRTACQI